MRKNGSRKRSATPRLSHDHEDGVEATWSREDAIAAPPRRVKNSFSAPVLTSSERILPSFTRRPSLVTGICVEINRLASRHFGVAVYASIQKAR